MTNDNPLRAYTDSQLEQELALRKEIQRQQEIAARVKRASFLFDKVPLLLAIVAEHDRTTCSDKNLQNPERCLRCFLVETNMRSYWDEDVDLQISLNRLKPL